MRCERSVVVNHDNRHIHIAVANAIEGVVHGPAYVSPLQCVEYTSAAKWRSGRRKKKKTGKKWIFFCLSFASAIDVCRHWPVMEPVLKYYIRYQYFMRANVVYTVHEWSMCSAEHKIDLVYACARSFCVENGKSNFTSARRARTQTLLWEFICICIYLMQFFFLCSFLGRPQPQVRWLVNGLLVDDQYEHNSGDVIENRLLWPAVQRTDLNAVFTCQAVNTLLVEPKENSYVLDLHCKWFILHFCDYNFHLWHTMPIYRPFEIRPAGRTTFGIKFLFFFFWIFQIHVPVICLCTFCHIPPGECDVW